MKTSLFFILFFCIFNAKAQGLTTSDYEKQEVLIEMRDGIKLFTTIYTPKTKKGDYPVLMIRTPYSVAPYGEDKMPERIMHNPDLIASGYIFVQQDVRGRWMSEGDFENTKPPYSFKDPSKTDEVTDSYDTYDWLVKNLKNFNGKIGQYGNSYLGYTSLVASVTGHPNLEAVLAMAPVTNFWFEDFNRYGLYGMNYMPLMDVFGVQKTEPRSESWYNVYNKEFVHNAENKITDDYYDYFLKHRALSSTDHMIDPNNFFWKNIVEHPNYDAYRQERDWIQYLDSTKCQTMIVGGWNDEQNLYGILNSFKKLANDNPKSKAQLVLGPWSHGHPQRRDTAYYLGDIFYGKDLSKIYQEEIEFNYFEYHLKGNGQAPSFKAHVFNTGSKEWVDFDTNPFNAPIDQPAISSVAFLNADGSFGAPSNVDSLEHMADYTTEEKRTFTSDPNHPVPFVNDDNFYILAPKKYMTDDQRFVSKRPDVLTYVSPPLDGDFTVLGEIKAALEFATDHEDADLYVKVIDVFPIDRLPEITDKPDVKMNGFQHLVRCGYIRGRYRDDFSAPKPFTPNKTEIIEVPLLEVFHTFKKGHRIMIQVQSSMFPLFDLNPQNYIENIYEAEDKDFAPAQHTVTGNSRIYLPTPNK